MTSLIELVVSRKVTLGHDAQHSARSDGGRAVVELGVDANGQSHEQQRVQVRGSLREIGEALLGGGKKSVLPKEVLAGVGREAQLGQHDDHRAVLGAGPARRLDARLDVEGDVRDAHLGRYRRDLNESVLHPVPPCGRRGAYCSLTEGFRSLGQRVTHRGNRKAISKNLPAPFNEQGGEVWLGTMFADRFSGVSRGSTQGSARGTRGCGAARGW